MRKTKVAECSTSAQDNKHLATKRTGSEPDRLKIEGDWEEAIKRALTKKRPPEGWPSPPGKKKRAKKGAK